MNLAWMTDIHLNFLNEAERKAFYQKISDTCCDAVLITGDIAEAPSFANILCEMASQIKRPIYFVLGNHDYYKGQVEEVRQEVSALTQSNELLFWLPASGMQLLNNETILLGQDGWADGRFGDYQNSRVVLNDSRLIADLFQMKILGKFQLLEKMQQLANADATRLQHDLYNAVLEQPKKIVVLTHVPPFKEACMHMGKISGEDWLPYFSSQVMGDVLKKIAEENPIIEFLVLCGHTHSPAMYKPLLNLIVKAGGTEYYQPEIQENIYI